LGQGFITFTPAQRDTLDRKFAELAADVAADSAGAEGPFEGLMTREAPLGSGRATNQVGYYAGAVAILFLLFSAVHGALSMVEERDNGMLDRILAGPTGMGAILGGKFCFLVLQGVTQVTLIFLVAWGWYRVPLLSHLVPFFVVTVAAAVSAAGLALLLTTACRTKRQAQTFANVAILTVSAVGGSMVPRFLMPEALKAVGWLTPTTWAIEAYSGIFWRQQPITAIWLPIVLLALTGLAALAVARLLAARDERL
jgi:ABC-2 type transport system permease protein